MNFIFVLMLLTLSAGVWSKSVKVHYNLEEAETLFENFIAKHGKVYKSEEEKLMRLEIFKNNLLEINRKNADPDYTAHYGITQFIDMTQTEFTAFVTGLKFPSEGYQSDCGPPILDSSNFSQAPDEFDWRSKGVVTPVKFQLNCGSCWAFSATGQLESQYAIKHNKTVLLSEQQLVHCVGPCRGCAGCSAIDYSFRYAQYEGLMTEEAYPYTGDEGICRADSDKSAIKVTGCNTYDLKDEEKLKELLLNKGPISVVVAAGWWGAYTGGILNKCSPEPLDHAVLLVAYGIENGTPYWSLKNSWSRNWGEEGYIRILRGSNECGLMNQYMATADVA